MAELKKMRRIDQNKLLMSSRRSQCDCVWIYKPSHCCSSNFTFCFSLSQRMTLSLRKTHRRLLLVHQFFKVFFCEPLERPEDCHRRCVSLKKIKNPLSWACLTLNCSLVPFGPGMGLPDVDVPLWQGLLSKHGATLEEITLNVRWQSGKRTSLMVSHGGKWFESTVDLFHFWWDSTHLNVTS